MKGMSIGYVAYIDESGCDGLKKIKPSPNGSSEWFVIACTLVSIEEDQNTMSWVRSIQNTIGLRRNADLHFRELNHYKKGIVTTKISTLPVRNFVVLSNKRNMVGYKNYRIQDDNRNWFYWWLVRLVLERVTE